MRAAVVLLVTMLCMGCGRRGEVHTDMLPVDVYGWQEPVSIVYENNDTTSLCDIAVALRYNDSFMSDTLSVVIHTSLPDAHQTRERVVLGLDRSYRATALTASQSVGYRENCQLSQRGCYIFTITPCRTVRGIEAVGVEIVK